MSVLVLVSVALVSVFSTLLVSTPVAFDLELDWYWCENFARNKITEPNEHEHEHEHEHEYEHEHEHEHACAYVYSIVSEHKYALQHHSWNLMSA